jgi:hypothetical protein
MANGSSILPYVTIHMWCVCAIVRWAFTKSWAIPLPSLTHSHTQTQTHTHTYTYVYTPAHTRTNTRTNTSDSHRELPAVMNRPHIIAAHGRHVHAVVEDLRQVKAHHGEVCYVENHADFVVQVVLADIQDVHFVFPRELPCPHIKNLPPPFADRVILWERHAGAGRGLRLTGLRSAAFGVISVTI